MTDSNRNVLRVNTVEEQTAYRKAVSEILLNIQNDHQTTLADIAGRIAVSLGTISNAANRKCDLSVVFLKRLGEVFGPATLDPYTKLVGGRVVPIISEGAADILPMIGRANLAIAEARDPGSPGGKDETHCEQLGYLPHLRALRRELDAAIHSIEERAA